MEKTITSKQIYDGKIIRVRVDQVLLPNDKIADREVVEHNGGVGVVALDENENIILVKQFRKPYDCELLEIPAGKLDPGEDPLECGKRELEEETGMLTDDFTDLGKMYPSPGYCNEIIHIYFAQDLKQGEVHLDEDEFLNTVKIPFEKAVDMVFNNEITDAKTIVGILKVFHQYYE